MTQITPIPRTGTDKNPWAQPVFIRVLCPGRLEAPLRRAVPAKNGIPCDGAQGRCGRFAAFVPPNDMGTPN